MSIHRPTTPLVEYCRKLEISRKLHGSTGADLENLQSHQTIPDDIQDLHFHIDDFKSNIEKEFTFLKEATCKNVENFQSFLNLQQTFQPPFQPTHDYWQCDTDRSTRL